MPAGFVDEINVKKIGARGDGVTDDTAALNTALSYLSQESGGALLLPAGVYVISSSLSVNPPTNILIRGGGVSCTQIARASGFSGATFSSLAGVVRCRDLTLPDFSINASNTAPSVPATTVALTNPFPFRCLVYVNAGTVTVIAIGGVTTGQVAGAFILNPGQTITLTYSVAPTWTWFGIEG